MIQIDTVGSGIAFIRQQCEVVDKSFANKLKGWVVTEASSQLGSGQWVAESQNFLIEVADWWYVV